MIIRYVSKMYNFFFFNDTATTEIYTLSLHDALPICARRSRRSSRQVAPWSVRRRWWIDRADKRISACPTRRSSARSEEHTSELQSRQYLVCRLLLEKKKYLVLLIIPLYSPPLPYPLL